MPTTEKFGDTHELPPWETVSASLARVATSVAVRAINGSALDALDYEIHKETGLNVIAIGGD